MTRAIENIKMIVLLKSTLIAIEKGMAIGIEKGVEKAKLNVVQNMILDGESEEKTKKYIGVSDKDIERIRKILETQGKQ